MTNKQQVFTFELDRDLHDEFITEAQAMQRPPSELLREFMSEFVRCRREAREHDAWFREKVEEALNDARPGIPQDVVMDQVRALIDRIAAAKSSV
jgi:predicted transcriptional regulator